ncbi:hypothetical protein Goari_022263 [Gossypium aridum]|uniref:Uncharacterized protein n=1 Tax=Gossypium aridum TaxID=34290 RepID=A0A7J8YS74_GOSAI|nr:hypothetical protein [Gossypium aridum]
MTQFQIYLTSLTKGSHSSRQSWLKLLDL